MRPLLLSLITALLCHAAAHAAERPNIVCILVDDMGFSDISCYGGEIPTPNIDALARNGVRFTQFYNTGRCCPTRASLLTGLYSHQTGIGLMTGDQKVEGYRGFLNDRCATAAELLRDAGYFTAHTGKWHVGHREQSMWPLQRGFDRFYGIVEGGGFYFKVKEGRTVKEGNDTIFSVSQQPPAGWYTTGVWTEQGIRFVDEALAAKKPFFLYVAHNAPHFPLQAPEEEIARYRGKFKAGWQKLRDARHQRQIEAGIVNKEWPLAPWPDAPPVWDSLSAEEQDRFDHLMAIYAAVMDRLDRSIGQLVSALKERGVLDNTLLVFLSDNGGTAEGGPRGRSEGPEPLGSAESDVFYGRGWATVSNTPFRRYKRFCHEGGISTPLIVHWPAQIREGGALRHQVGHVIDLVPTFLDAAGAKYPAEHNGKPLIPLEGRSLTPAFAGQPIERDALFWEHEGNAAVRSGDWKLVRAGRGASWELYNLKTDRTEMNNLAQEEPERVKDLTSRWMAWAQRAHVKPYPGKAKNSPAN